MFRFAQARIVGTFHYVSKQHLRRYLNEFHFRYNGRYVNDGNFWLSGVKRERDLLTGTHAETPQSARVRAIEAVA
ncbi:MAG: transposase [Candidatus Acidiferrales bacterium]